MKAIILAAGRGSRLGALTNDKPKGLVQLAGRSLIAWAIDSLRSAGIHEIAIVAGYRAELIDFPDTTRFLNASWNETNMVSTLCCAEAWLTSDTCLVSYSDIFYATDWVRFLMQAKQDVAITYDIDWLSLWSHRSGDPLADAETFETDGNGRLIEIGNKPTQLSQCQGQYMGLLRFTPTGWRQAKNALDGLDHARRKRLDMTSLLRLMLSNQVTIEAIPVNGRWGEVDTPDDIRLYERMIRDGALTLPA